MVDQAYETRRRWLAWPLCAWRGHPTESGYCRCRGTITYPARQGKRHGLFTGERCPDCGVNQYDAYAYAFDPDECPPRWHGAV